jgi:hypothetical protein
MQADVTTAQAVEPTCVSSRQAGVASEEHCAAVDQLITHIPMLNSPFIRVWCPGHLWH